ncbi:MAG: hypothetical protein E7598_07450 [Ruminococcaceae bacterium]|nr:hypothetical protein [Oscillospiraceae bacterium]
MKKSRINILDFLIIALVALCIVGAVLRMYAKSNEDKFGDYTATVSFLIQDVQNESKDLIKAGDRLYSEAYGCEFGTIVGNVINTNAVYYAEDDGEIIRVESGINPETNEPYRVDLYGKFECNGAWTAENGFSIGGTQYIAPNMSVALSFPNIKATVLILDVEVEKAK